MPVSATIIACISIHHGNTRRVAEAIASATGAALLEPGSEALSAAAGGALLGLGSGIFFGSHHRGLLQFARTLPPVEGRRAFLFSTSGTGCHLPRLVGIDYHRRLRHILTARGYAIAGEFSCRGYDTYGPWGKLGGVARGHPTDADLEDARAFGRGLVSAAA